MSAPREYSAEVRRLFARPAHAGPLRAGTGARLAAESLALDRRAWVRFEVRIESGMVAATVFRAWGCPHFLAACELAAGWLEGRPLESAAHCRSGWLAGELQVPADKLGRLLVIEDALRDLAARRAEPK